MAACFSDHRQPDRIQHSLSTLVSQRIVAIALGYEDLNDHDQLRHDPLMALFSEKGHSSGSAPLAGKSTLNRLELAPSNGPDHYHKIDHDPEALQAGAVCRRASAIFRGVWVAGVDKPGL